MCVHARVKHPRHDGEYGLPLGIELMHEHTAQPSVAAPAFIHQIMRRAQ